MGSRGDGLPGYVTRGGRASVRPPIRDRLSLHSRGDRLRTAELAAKALVASVFFVERWAGRLALALLISSGVVLLWDITVWLFKADWRTSSFIYPPAAFLLGGAAEIIRQKCDAWIMRKVEEDRVRRLQL